jgi:hypothetical protein
VHVETRKQNLTSLFFIVSAMLDRAIADLPAPDAKQAAQLLSDFRDRIEGDRTRSDARLAAKWTPAACARDFALLAALLLKLGAKFPQLGGWASDLTAYLNTLSSDEPDECQVFDIVLDTYVSKRWGAFITEYWEDYRREIARAHRMSHAIALRREFLAARLQSTYTVSRALTDNNDILGAILEETLREVVTSVVTPFAVSTGGFYGLKQMKQIDVVVWDRSHGPAAVEVGAIAIVPPTAVCGILEIKASCDSSLATFGIRIAEIDAELSVAKEVLDTNVHTPGALGFVIWSDFSADDVRLQSGGRVCALFRRGGDGALTSNFDEIDVLLQLLQGITGVYSGRIAPPN